MANCSKCGASLVNKARFCAACGSPVVSGSTAPPPPAPPKSAPADPFARTVLGDESSAPTAEALIAAARASRQVQLQAQPQPAVSPMAASVMKEDPPLPPQQPRAQLVNPVASPAWSASPQAQYAQPAVAPSAPPPPPLFAPGSLVLVYWADGNQYPGTVLQVAPYHALVAFPNGGQQWIELRYLTTGR